MINKSKLVIPAPPRRHVPRPGTSALLESELDRGLTIVQAGAGYGKTTAVADWARTTPRATAWVTVDVNDNEPRRYLAHILAALADRLGSERVASAQQALEEGAGLTGACVPELANALAGTGSAPVVVLDDYHLISAPAVHAVTMALLDTRDPGVALVITTRTRPPLRTARRLAADMLALVGPDALAFSAAETDQLLNQAYELGLRADTLAVIQERMAGWPAGLTLLARAVPTGESGHTVALEALSEISAGALVDYVAEEVLAGAEGDQARFLQRIAIAPRINAELAAAITQDPDAHLRLERLRAEAQLVSSDGRAGGWVRIHDLIRDSLQLTLRRHEPKLVPQLHARASGWMESAGLIEEALTHAVAAGDGDRLAELLLRHGAGLALARHTYPLRHALDTLAAHEQMTPFTEALDLVVRLFDGSDLAPLAERAAMLYRQHPDRPEVQTLSAVLAASPAGGQVSTAIAIGTEALQRYGHLPEFRRRIAAPLACALMADNRFDELRELIDIQLNDTLVGQIYRRSLQAAIATHQQDTTAAEWYADAAIELLARHGDGHTGDLSWVRVPIADALRVSGRLTDARRQLEIGQAAERARSASPIQIGMALCDAELSLAQRRRDKASNSLALALELIPQFDDVGARQRDRAERLRTALQGDRIDPMLGSDPTAAELRILRALEATGSRSAIAGMLFLSEDTVKTHLRRLYRRLGVNKRDDALRVARARGLLRSHASGSDRTGERTR